MKGSFSGFYQPTADQYERLWNEALFVLDTNVLLDLYRLPSQARDELLAVLELLKDRLWIPHQVGVEFQLRRLSIIAGERKTTEEVLKSAQNMVDEVMSKVNALQIDKRGVNIESKTLLDGLKNANDELIKVIKAVHDSQLEISSKDVVRESLDLLLDGRVGVGPSNQDELDALIQDGEDRFSHKIPPGFADTPKGKDPNEAYFIFDHIKYPRKFGDLILWKQLLNHVREQQKNTVLFITNDRKDDWWWREQGKTIGPHPELIREMIRSGGVEIFWMYSSLQFVEQANKFSHAKVSTDTVAEIEQVSIGTQSDSDIEIPPVVAYNDALNANGGFSQTNEKNIYQRDFEKFAIYEWLKGRYSDVYISHSGAVDFMTGFGHAAHAFLIVNNLNLDPMLTEISPSFNILRAKQDLGRGIYGRLSMIVLMDFHEISLLSGKYSESFRNKLMSFMSRHKISEIVVGSVGHGQFEMHMMQRLGRAPSELDA